MSFRTNKCNHGERGRCINCLTEQLKIQKKIEKQTEVVEQKLKCIHPPNMKCLKCISSKIVSKIKDGGCKHSNYQRCFQCNKIQQYQTFEDYVQNLTNNCKHKKPCKKCVPLQARKTLGIDLECRNHLPYPQAQCDACMVPTITIKKQPYSHIKKIIIKTSSIERIIDANLFGILLGQQTQGVIYVEDIFFPEEQVPKSQYLSPEILPKYCEILQYLGYWPVGLIYSSSQITAKGLMLSSRFQQYFVAFDQNNYPFSKFITMRLHWNESDIYFQCFMVSDIFQTLLKNQLIFEKNNNKDYFDLITVKGDKKDKTKSMPTFLREGVQVEEIYFKQVIVWIETVSQQDYSSFNKNLLYPFFKVEEQTIKDMQWFLQIYFEDPLEKFRNVQFLLHMLKLFGRKNMILFITDFLYSEPQLFIREKLKQAKKNQKIQWQKLQESITTPNY